MSDLESLIRAIVRAEIAAVTKPANDAPEYLSVAEAAAHARVSVYTVRRWIKRGELTRHTAGTRLLVDRAELDRFLACEIVPIESRMTTDAWIKRRFG
jgi:excisionase family DNA binding protein